MKHQELARAMGRVVTVTATLERELQGNDARWQRVELPEARSGWIVGYRWVLQGTRVPGSSWSARSAGYWEDDGGYDPPTFRETGPRTPCWLVCWWPTQKPVHVPLDGWREPRADEAPRPPGYRWTETERQQLSLESASFVRDPKGRFTAESTERPSTLSREEVEELLERGRKHADELRETLKHMSDVDLSLRLR